MITFANNLLNYRKVERDFERFIRLASSGEVQQALGSNALTLLALAKNFFIPNFRDGVISIPKRYRDSDAFPVLPVRRGAPLTLSSDFIHNTPLQRHFIAKQLGTYGLDQSIAGALMREIATVKEKSPVKLKSPAAVSGSPVGVTASSSEMESVSFFVTQRPLMLLDEQSRQPPSGIGHELVHVMQTIKQPLFTSSPEGEPTDREYRELEAYQTGAILERFEGQGQTIQQFIDDARVRFTHPDRPMEATQPLRDYLMQNNCGGWADGE